MAKTYTKQSLIHLEGRRVMCVEMEEDPQPVPGGMMGTVSMIDDLPQIHVKWDNGQTLALLPGIDKWRVLVEKKLWVVGYGSDADGLNSGSIYKFPTTEEAVKAADQFNDRSAGITYTCVNEEAARKYCNDFLKDFNKDFNKV